MLIAAISGLKRNQFEIRGGIIILLTAVFSGQALASEVAGLASVIDADTIEVHGKRIRLHGVDAPEKGQPCNDPAGRPYRCGTIAARALDQFIGASPVACRERDIDQYGRTVANCSVRGEDIELWLVRNGYAMAYRRYSTELHWSRARSQKQPAWYLGRITYPAMGMAKTASESHKEPPPP